MTEPYTDEELADIRTRRIGNLDGVEQRRLLATLDAAQASAENWKARARERSIMYRDLLYKRTLPAEERAEAASLRAIEASNPGINMDEVRRTFGHHPHTEGTPS